MVPVAVMVVERFASQTWEVPEVCLGSEAWDGKLKLSQRSEIPARCETKQQEVTLCGRPSELR